jgi:3-hydroxyisobutyrate dehydrogenase-like beta-hydroxyacid dehydrogenase
MAERRFLPAQGTVPALQHYFPMIGDFAESVGVATPMLNCAAALYERFIAMGFAEFDGAKMVDVIGSLPRLTTKREMKTKARKAKPKGEPA